MSRKNSIKRPRVKFFTLKKSADSFAKKVNGESLDSKDGRFYVKYEGTNGYQGTRPIDYDDWWQECNLDGSFAYNGVTDDF